jgi:hypothetical protein
VVSADGLLKKVKIILQKFSNYNLKLAIIGDFTTVKSSNLNDFIRENNKRTSINFVSSIDEAVTAFGIT